MKVDNSYFAVLLFSSWSLFFMAVSGDKFDINKCPWFYLQENDSEGDWPTPWLVATCAVDQNLQEFRTSSINLDYCLTNLNGWLVPANPAVKYVGPFSKSCSNCGLVYHGPRADDNNKWSVRLSCICHPAVGGDPKEGSAAWIDLETALDVTNGTMECQSHTGNILPYVTDATPKMIPPLFTTTTSDTTYINNTVTSTETATSNNTITATETVMASTTIVNTTTDTAVTTAVSSCPSHTKVTVTKTKSKETVTTSVTATALITVLVSVPVTETHKPTIVANLQTTVEASFATI
ncbi:hypothetical protein F4804DRAFT_352632 [Jackrogersella minutella]|nr:hypothetical protein F4804DRAFT_352632 [Jackrogersella minutella]